MVIEVFLYIFFLCQRERERGTLISYLAHSSDALSSGGLARPKQGARISVQVSHMCGRDTTIEPAWLPLVYTLVGNQNWKGNQHEFSTWTWNTGIFVSMSHAYLFSLA